MMWRVKWVLISPTHREGDLENREYEFWKMIFSTHRVGDLEIFNTNKYNDSLATHRGGDLEKEDEHRHIRQTYSS